MPATRMCSCWSGARRRTGARSLSHARDACSHGRRLPVAFAETTNPTQLNGRPATPGETYPLEDGDRLELGDVRLRFRLQEARQP